jgi:hypothetical protein
MFKKDAHPAHSRWAVRSLPVTKTKKYFTLMPVYCTISEIYMIWSRRHRIKRGSGFSEPESIECRVNLVLLVLSIKSLFAT